MANLKPPALRYRILSFLLLPLWLLHAVLQSLKQKDFTYLAQRLGFYPSSIQSALWVHAASVGEVELMSPLVTELSKDHPVVITTFTATGYQHAKRILPTNILVQILPIDLQPISRKFIRHFKFRLGLVAETELWPETLYQLKRQNVALLHINARLSVKSTNKPNWIKTILSQTLDYFELHLTRTKQDVETLTSMKVNRSKIRQCGNLKYAKTINPNQSELLDLIGRPYLLFASTRETEEPMFAAIGQALQQNPEITDPAKQLVVIAPRHPKRADEIKRKLKALGIIPVQRSLNETINDDTRFYLADTLGELKSLMAHARLVVMGGSFADVGGHNILEPAQLGKAVITGPSDSNIHADICMLKQHDAIIQVEDKEELQQQLMQLLLHPEKIDRLSSNARQMTSQQTHVLQDYLQQIKPYLD